MIMGSPSTRSVPFCRWWVSAPRRRPRPPANTTASVIVASPWFAQSAMGPKQRCHETGQKAINDKNMFVLLSVYVREGKCGSVSYLRSNTGNKRRKEQVFCRGNRDGLCCYRRQPILSRLHTAFIQGTQTRVTRSRAKKTRSISTGDERGGRSSI